MTSHGVLFAFPPSVQTDEKGGRIQVDANSTDPLPTTSDVAILLDGCTNNSEMTTQRRVDLSKMFREGGRLVVFLGPEGFSGAQTNLGVWLVDTLGVAIRHHPTVLTPLERRLDPFLHGQVAHVSLRPVDDLEHQVLATGGPEKREVALSFRHQKAQVFLLPLRTLTAAVADAERALALLPLGVEYPRYLDAIPLGNETELRASRADLERQLADTDAALLAFESAKRILYLTDFELQAEVVRFLNDELGISGRAEESNREDFWLLDSEEASEFCIGEVKGPGNSNLTKGDVGALMSHREEAGRREDFPAMLVGNTFHRRHTAEQRDVGIPEPVARLGASEHVLIMRTLDLIRVRDLQLRDDPAAPQIAQVARQRGGWLEISADGGTVLHPA